MPWSQLSPMDQKTQFIADYLRQSLSITELCLHYGISRKTAYKWISRYHALGLAGLQERSRKPHACPHQTEPRLVEALLEARRHPTWGAKKLLKLLRKNDPSRDWPARSTVCDLLARHDLIKKPRPRRHLSHPGKPATVITAANQVWCADFKGQFKTKDGLYCYPLTTPTASRATCLPVRGYFRLRWLTLSPFLRGFFASTACPLRSAPTTACRSPPSRWRGCRHCPPGGYGWASCRS